MPLILFLEILKEFKIIYFIIIIYFY